MQRVYGYCGYIRRPMEFHCDRKRRVRKLVGGRTHIIISYFRVRRIFARKKKKKILNNGQRASRRHTF